MCYSVQGERACVSESRVSKCVVVSGVHCSVRESVLMCVCRVGECVLVNAV